MKKLADFVAHLLFGPKEPDDSASFYEDGKSTRQPNGGDGPKLLFFDDETLRFLKKINGAAI